MKSHVSNNLFIHYICGLWIIQYNTCHPTTQQSIDNERPQLPAFWKIHEFIQFINERKNDAPSFTLSLYQTDQNSEREMYARTSQSYEIVRYVLQKPSTRH